MRKTVNIIIFAAAILACILILIFAGSFNEKSKEKYNATMQVKVDHPEVLTDLEAVTIETLPAYVSKYQAVIDSSDKLLKADELQKDIFYTYIVNLKKITDDASFEAYKADFPHTSSVLFAQAENKDYFVNGFKEVQTYADLFSYINTLSEDYDVVKQDYLTKAQGIKAMALFVKWTSDINSAISKDKKVFDLTSLQEDVKSFGSQSATINASLYITYLFVIITVVLLLGFAIYSLITNFKDSVGMLMGLAVVFIIAIIGYFVSPDQLTPSAIKLGLTPNGFKWVGSGVITCYCLLIGVFVAIIGSAIMNLIKNR